MLDLPGYYIISPSVVPADQITKIKIYSFDESLFNDGEKYIVDIIPHTYPSKPFSDGYKLSDIVYNNRRYEAVAKDGILEIEHYFAGEQKWKLHVFEAALAPDFHIDDPDNWEPYLKSLEIGCMLKMYSLKPDLYELRPYKGDLHLHTSHSDGLEEPVVVAANYRRAGYDFISMTDHHVHTAAKEANAVYKGLKTNFVIYNGEEIHNDHMGNIHIVNFDSVYSVNELILGEKTRPCVLREIEDIKNSEDLKGVFDKTDIAWRIWVYREIKKSGGLAIFPHPYWNICDMEHSSPEAIEYTFKNRLMDVYEIFGGVSHSENNLQALLYFEMKEKGYSYPIVGSTDSHSTADGAEYFKGAYTVAFAKDVRSVRHAIESGMTAAVQSDSNKYNIVGSLRLAKYTDFLIQNYFGLHDAYCIASGDMMNMYLCSEDKNGIKSSIESVEKEIKEFETIFFG